MDNISVAIASVGIGGVLGIIATYIQLKKTHKAEIVDPDIKNLEQRLTILEKTMADKISRMEESTSRSVANLDRKFDELSKKWDVTNQHVSQIQGMLTAMFNGLQRDGMNYGQ